jgi:hypothetical protein
LLKSLKEILKKEIELIATWCLLVKDQESLKYFYQEINNWQKVLIEYNKIVKV